ncbi:hypothetical protein RDWZM_000424 [Blomia tropicalis]|uniref:Uncharacterized protein n=1 Tax=Blomia tropicalis TaxID=40697 RepID=A0A9Q0MAC2_BLOTA|nr:hypothetical protein RDWZM_000424 [Blomia tropicalis]
MSINNNRIISNNVTPKTGVLFHDHKSNNNILSTRFNNNNNNRNHEGDSLGSRYNSKDSANSSLLSMFSTYNNSLNCKQSGSTTSSLSSFSQQELSSNLTQKKRKEKIKYSIFNSSTSSLTDLSDIGNNSTVNTNYGGNSSSLNLILENQSLLEWIEQGLDRCGIDSTVYGVYVLSLLNNLTTDLDESEVKQISTNVPQRTRSPSVSRYCDFHQRLYPGLNLRQSRIKLLRSESKHLNTQKAASTTKFMHKRYQQQQQQQNGVRGASPVGFESLIDDDLSDTAATRHCPDCAHQRNNYGTSTCSWNDRPSTIVSHEKHLYNNNRSRIVDYRKATIIDCLRDATDQV